MTRPSSSLFLSLICWAVGPDSLRDPTDERKRELAWRVIGDFLKTVVAPDDWKTTGILQEFHTLLLHWAVGYPEVTPGFLHGILQPK